MASLQILESTLSPISFLQKNFPGNYNSRRKTILKLKNLSSRRYIQKQRLTIICSVQDGDTQNNGEEAPESLFMKELKRRGLTPTSLLEESNKSGYGLEDEMKIGEEDRGFSKRKVVSTEFDSSLTNQRETSMALNSEGLEDLACQISEVVLVGFSKRLSGHQTYKPMCGSGTFLVLGLVPRAKLLLTIGGTFFLGFWPLILVTVGFFSALYFLFGSSFVHDAGNAPISPPPYVDPYELLEDERISQIAPSLN